MAGSIAEQCIGHRLTNTNLFSLEMGASSNTWYPTTAQEETAAIGLFECFLFRNNVNSEQYVIYSEMGSGEKFWVNFKKINSFKYSLVGSNGTINSATITISTAEVPLERWSHLTIRGSATEFLELRIGAAERNSNNEIIGAWHTYPYGSGTNSGIEIITNFKEAVMPFKGAAIGDSPPIFALGSKGQASKGFAGGLAEFRMWTGWHSDADIIANREVAVGDDVVTYPDLAHLFRLNEDIDSAAGDFVDIGYLTGNFDTAYGPEYFGLDTYPFPITSSIGTPFSGEAIAEAIVSAHLTAPVQFTANSVCLSIDNAAQLGVGGITPFIATQNISQSIIESKASAKVAFSSTAVIQTITTAALTGPQPYTDKILSYNPMAYWKIEELQGATTALDSSSNSKNGTYSVVPAPTLQETGPLLAEESKCGLFVDSSAITANSSSAFNMAGTESSYIVWFKRNNDTVGTDSRLFDKHLSMRLQFKDVTHTVLRTTMYGSNASGNPSANFETVTTISETDSNWHMAALSWDQSRGMHIYIDGALDSSSGVGPVWQSAPSDNLDNTMSLSKTNNLAFIGWLDEFCILPVALTGPQIRELYNLALNIPVLTASAQSSAISSAVLTKTAGAAQTFSVSAICESISTGSISRKVELQTSGIVQSVGTASISRVRKLASVVISESISGAELDKRVSLAIDTASHAVVSAELNRKAILGGTSVTESIVDSQLSIRKLFVAVSVMQSIAGASASRTRLFSNSAITQTVSAGAAKSTNRFTASGVAPAIVVGTLTKILGGTNLAASSQASAIVSVASLSNRVLFSTTAISEVIGTATLSRRRSFTAAVSEIEAWYDAAWPYRKDLIVDNTKVAGSINHVDFPILFSFTDSDLTKALANGNDILFTDADTASPVKLDHEIQSWDSGVAGEIIAWVKAPILDTGQDTNFHVYYGNSSASDQRNTTGVWGDYLDVRHLHQTDAEGLSDSAGNHVDLTIVGSSPQTGGQIGNARSFDGSTQYLTLPNASGVVEVGDTTYTVQAWAYKNDFISQFVCLQAASSFTERPFRLNTSTSKIIRFQNTTDSGTYQAVAANAYNTGEWFFVAGAYNGNEAELTNSGVLLNRNENATGDPLLDANSTYRIGADITPNFHWNGILDEVRVCSLFRSVDWLRTEFNNQSTPSSFYSIGLEETLTRAAPLVQAISAGSFLKKVKFSGSAVCLSTSDARSSKTAQLVAASIAPAVITSILTRTTGPAALVGSGIATTVSIASLDVVTAFTGFAVVEATNSATLDSRRIVSAAATSISVTTSALSITSTLAAAVITPAVSTGVLTRTVPASALVGSGVAQAVTAAAISRSTQLAATNISESVISAQLGIRSAPTATVISVAQSQATIIPLRSFVATVHIAESIITSTVDSRRSLSSTSIAETVTAGSVFTTNAYASLAVAPAVTASVLTRILGGKFFAGSAGISATSVGALVTSKRLISSGVALAASSAEVSSRIPFLATIQTQAVIGASLSVRQTLASSVISTSIATATLSTSGKLIGSATALAVSTADLNKSVIVSAADISHTISNGQLSLRRSITAAAQSLTISSASISIPSILTSSVVASAVSAATINKSIQFTAVSVAQATATADLVKTSALSASSIALASVSIPSLVVGGVVTFKATDIQAISVADANINASIMFAGSVINQAVSSAILSKLVKFSAQAVVITTSAAPGINPRISLLAAAVTQGISTSVSAITSKFISSVTCPTQSQGQFAISGLFAPGSATGISSSAGQVSVIKEFTSSATTISVSAADNIPRRSFSSISITRCISSGDFGFAIRLFSGSGQASMVTAANMRAGFIFNASAITTTKTRAALQKTSALPSIGGRYQIRVAFDGVTDEIDSVQTTDRY